MRKRGIEMEESKYKVYIDTTPNIYEEDLVNFISERTKIDEETCSAALDNFNESYRIYTSPYLYDILTTSHFSYCLIYGTIMKAINDEELPNSFRLIT